MNRLSRLLVLVVLLAAASGCETRDTNRNTDTPLPPADTTQVLADTTATEPDSGESRWYVKAHERHTPEARLEQARQALARLRELDATSEVWSEGDPGDELYHTWGELGELLKNYENCRDTLLPILVEFPVRVEWEMADKISALFPFDTPALRDTMRAYIGVEDEVVRRSAMSYTLRVMQDTAAVWPLVQQFRDAEMLPDFTGDWVADTLRAWALSDPREYRRYARLIESWNTRQLYTGNELTVAGRDQIVDSGLLQEMALNTLAHYDTVDMKASRSRMERRGNLNWISQNVGQYGLCEVIPAMGYLIHEEELIAQRAYLSWLRLEAEDNDTYATAMIEAVLADSTVDELYKQRIRRSRERMSKN